MHPAAFEYVRAGSADEALAALAEHGDDAKLLAGGHSLLPLMKLRLATPAVLVDIGGLDDLAYVREVDGVLAVGALTRHVTLETDPTVRRRLPVLAEVAAVVGDPQVRNRGTLGGSLAHGDPASDLPAAALVLDATLVVDGPRGRREVRACDFFTGFLETAVAPDELLVEVRFPLRDHAPATGSYHKLTRRSQDWAIVAAAAARVPGSPDEARVALVNMGPVPLRATAVEAALAAGASATEAAELAADDAEPPADIHASVDYRRHLARVLVSRALADAGFA